MSFNLPSHWQASESGSETAVQSERSASEYIEVAARSAPDLHEESITFDEGSFFAPENQAIYGAPAWLKTSGEVCESSSVTVVHSGFGSFDELSTEPTQTKLGPLFPPPIHRHSRETDAIYASKKESECEETFDGLAYVKANLLAGQQQRQKITEMMEQQEETSKAASIAKTIRFDRPYFDDQEAQDFQFDKPVPHEEQKLLIDYINSNIENGKPYLTYCSICKEHHIPPGPPITLSDRDTCGSLLPAWFPKNKFTKPWESYRLFINDWVELGEFVSGRKEICSLQILDEEFEKFAPWRAKGFEWFRCAVDGSNDQSGNDNCSTCKQIEVLLVRDETPYRPGLEMMSHWVDVHSKELIGTNSGGRVEGRAFEGLPFLLDDSKMDLPAVEAGDDNVLKAGKHRLMPFRLD